MAAMFGKVRLRTWFSSVGVMLLGVYYNYSGDGWSNRDIAIMTILVVALVLDFFRDIYKNKSR